MRWLANVNRPMSGVVAPLAEKDGDPSSAPTIDTVYHHV